VGPSRALEPVIRALAYSPKAALVIRGPGIEHFSESYRDIAIEHGVANRLHMMPPVESSRVVSAARGADCGIYTVANICKSFTYALPNKVFEYLMADLPVLTANYPEVQRLAVEGGVGLGFDPEDPASIAATINQMHDSATRSRLKSAIPPLLLENSAEREWQKLLQLYKALPTADNIKISSIPAR
jgi:glycosyltransferase involved in cell wall biosynthesis